MLERLNRMSLQWWFGHALILVMAVGVVGVAALLTPSYDAVSLYGGDVPVLCGWRRLTGWPCLGCGLTRSFAFMAHGRLADAFRMHPLGPLLFMGVAAQIPWRSFILWRGPRAADGAAAPSPSP